MNPIVLKYLEEVARVKTEVKAKQERKERELLKKKFDKPVGIYYEDGEVRQYFFVALGLVFPLVLSKPTDVRLWKKKKKNAKPSHI